MQGPDRRRWVAGRPGRGQITTRADPGAASRTPGHTPPPDRHLHSPRPNLLQRPRSHRSAGRESLIFRASSRRQFRREAPLQQIWTGPRPSQSQESHASQRVRTPFVWETMEAGNGVLGGSFRHPPDSAAARTAESCGNRRAHPGRSSERSSQSATFRPRLPGKAGQEAAEASPGPAPGGTRKDSALAGAAPPAVDEIAGLGGLSARGRGSRGRCPRPARSRRS